MNIESIKAQAKKEVDEENTKEAVQLLKKEYKLLKDAEQVVLNCKTSIKDLEASIEDGTAFDG